MMERAREAVEYIRETPRRRAVISHATREDREDDVGIRLMLEIGALSPEMFSYLWMALDAGQSILFIGPPFSGKKQLMFSLSPFIQREEKAIVFGNGTKGMRYYHNFISFVSGKKVTSEQVGSARHHGADRIILDRMVGSEARELFSCANYGIPFMSTLDTTTKPRELIEVLQENPTKIASNTINMLDIVVSMNQGPSSVWKLNEITEIRWLSRSEIWLDEAKNLPDFGFKLTSIVKEGKLDAKLIGESKAIGAYCDLNLVSRTTAMKEFNARALFLSKIKDSKLSDIDYVSGYYEKAKA